ncbi:MAG TPA: hypothetical protein VGE08_06590 [Steroidobacter sp.]|uniref:hypothetical protein n=1 Tax=Steroidobacter sp. TaxID=1978227 RepID=UPI002EDB499E
MIRAVALSCFFVATLTSCGTAVSQAAQPVDLGAEVMLAPGESASFRSAGIVVQFLGVTKDSRCPRDTTCMWAGDAAVLLSIRNPRQAPIRHEVLEGEHVIAGDYLITVVRVQPEPVAPAKIPQESYRATLQLQKL